MQSFIFLNFFLTNLLALVRVVQWHESLQQFVETDFLHLGVLVDLCYCCQKNKVFCLQLGLFKKKKKTQRE